MGLSLVVSSEEDAPAIAAGEPVRAFSRIAALAADGAPAEAVLSEITREACELLGVTRGSLFTPVTDADCFAGRVAVPGESSVRRMVCGTEADGFTREILATRRPVAIDNAESDRRPIRTTMRRWGVRSIIGFPMTIGSEVVGLIFLDDPGCRRAFGRGAVAAVATFADLAAVLVAQLGATDELRAGMEAMRRQNDLLRRGRELDERLTALALDAESIDDVVTGVAGLTGMPAFLHDADGRSIASATPDGRSVPVRCVLDRALRERADIAGALAELRGNKPAIIGPFADAGFHRRAIVAAVRVSGACVGHLGILEDTRRATALDVGVVHRAAAMIGLRMAAERRFAAVDASARTALIRDLVSGTEDEWAVAERAALHGIPLSPTYAVILVEARTPGAALPALADVSEALRQAGQPRPLVAVVDGDVVALLELPAQASWIVGMRHVKAAVERAVERLCARHDVIAAVASRAMLPAEGPTALGECRELLRLLRTAGDGPGQRVIAADDLGAGRLALSPTGRGDARRFAEHTLGPLMETGEAEMLVTLEAFFDCGRNARLAGDQLGVHENTIRYRLTRIRQLTGLDLAASADDQLCGHLAILILRQLGARTVQLVAASG